MERFAALLLSRRFAVLLVLLLLAGGFPAAVQAAVFPFPGVTLAASDLAVNKSHTNNFYQGQVGAKYTLTASNVGNAATAGVYTLRDRIPEGLLFSSAAGNGWTCAYDPATLEALCTRQVVIQPGQSAPPVTLTVDVSPTAAAQITNSATVSGGGQVNTANDRDDDLTVVDPRADVTLTKQHEGVFSQGQAGAAYILTVSNIGDSAAMGIHLVDTLPEGLVYQSAAGVGWNCFYTTGTRQVECSRTGSLLPGKTSSLTLLVNVTTNAPGEVTNQAEVGATYDRDTGNNLASDRTLIQTTADVTISKTHSDPFWQGQEGAQYQLVVTNLGRGPTSQPVTVTDTLPEGLAAVDLFGEGWSCEPAALTCTRADPLAVQASYPAITLVVNVAGDAPGSVTNQAVVSGGGDATPGNNTASDPTSIRSFPDLLLEKSHAGDFRQGQTGAEYTLRVTNGGGGPTSGPVTVREQVPAGLQVTGMGGEGWQCGLDTLTCTRSDALLPGHTYAPVVLAVTVADDAPPLVLNRASVEGGGEQNTTNNSASDPTTIQQAADLVISKTHAGDFYPGQHGASFTLVVSNSGTGGTSADTRVVEQPPAWLAITGMAGLGWNCPPASGICTRGDILNPGESFPPITVTVNVLPDAPGPLVNTALVSGGGELKVSNNSASDTVMLRPAVDLQVVKSHSGPVLRGQRGLTFTITASNMGASPSSGPVSVVDMPDAVFQPVGMSGPGWTCSLETLTCTRGDGLPPGGAYPPVTLAVNVAEDAEGRHANRVTISGDDRLPENNSAVDYVDILPAADLTVAVEHAGTFSRGQLDAAYTITVRNSGNGPTSAPVEVQDLLPAGLSAVSFDETTGWDCDPASLTCTRADVLGAGKSYPALRLTVRVADDAPYTVVNAVEVSGGGEMREDNNRAEDITDISAAPWVIESPADRQACAGGLVIFSARAEGNPLPAIQWQARAGDGQEWLDLPGEKGETLALTAAEADDGKAYRAVFTNAAGQSASQPASLTVYTVPAITGEPQDQAVTPGQVVTFAASADGRPAPTLRWQVQAGLLAWADLAGESGPALSFAAALGQDGFRYRAVATNQCGSAESRAALLAVIGYERLFLPLIAR